MKKCSVCGKNKAESGYYKGMAKCKDCHIAAVKEYRLANIDKVRAYDRQRGCRQTSEELKERRKKYPRQYKAQTFIGNALRDGRLKRMPCEVCSSRKKVHAHHDDYNYPLNIRWLCAAHHKQWHTEHGEAKNR